MARIGVDTNVLVRLFVRDDAAQTGIVEKFADRLGKDDVIFVNLVVLIETLWTLRRLYGYAPAQLHDLVQAMLERHDLELGEHEAVGNALYRARNSRADISDALIHELNAMQRCVKTMTFDVKAARLIPGMELLT